MRFHPSVIALLCIPARVPAQPPHRIISTRPSITSTTYALGLDSTASHHRTDANYVQMLGSPALSPGVLGGGLRVNW